MTQKKMCELDPMLECNGCGDCDRCDLDPTKICDNCMKCIHTGADYNAVEIDTIDFFEITQEDS